MNTNPSQKPRRAKLIHILCAISLVALFVPTVALGAPQQAATEAATAIEALTQGQAETPSTAVTAQTAQTAEAPSSATTAETASAQTPTTLAETLSAQTAAATQSVEAPTTADTAAAALAQVSTMSEDGDLQPQATGRDISQYLTNFRFDLLHYISAGNTPVINENDSLTLFEELGVITEFDVSGVPSGINSGDYFSYTLTLPGISGDSATYTDKPFKVEGRTRGTWSTVYTPATATEYAKLTFTVELDNSWTGTSQDLSNAGIKIERFGQNSDNQNLDAGGKAFEKDVTIGTTTTTVKKHYKVPGYNNNTRPITNRKDAKTSADRGNNLIFWMVNYGWSNLAKLTETQGAQYANNGADGSMMDPTAQDNIIIDTLSYVDSKTNNTVKAVSVNDIVIGALVCAPSSTSDPIGNESVQLVANQAGDTRGINNWFTRVDKTSADYATVQDYANSLEARQYGVYTAADGTLSVCVNYGKFGTDDTPTMEWAYGSDWANSLVSNAINMGYATEADRAELLAMVKKTYGADNVLGGHIPYIQLNITVQYPIFDEMDGITAGALNTVTTSTEKIPQGSKGYSNVFSWGEVKPNQLKAFKYDYSNNTPLAGAKLKLQVRVQSPSGTDTWVDYAPLDGPGDTLGPIVRETGVDGMVEWNHLKVGFYRLVEVAAPTGYELGTVTADAGGCVVGSFDHPNDGDDGPWHTIAVKNTAAPGTLTLTKTLDGALREDNTFYFRVSGPLGYYKIVPLTVTAGTTTASANLTSLQPGEYTVSEARNEIGEPVENNRLTTDKYSFTVSGNNTKVTVDKDSTPAVNITNTRATTAQVTPSVTKTLSGALPSGFTENFTAAITAKTANAPMPDNTTATASVRSNSETPFNGFGAITFDKPGTYEYEITENAGTTLGMEYDTNTYTMTVVITDNFGAKVTYAGGTTATDKAQIKNTYTPPKATVTPIATKTLTGTLPAGFSETFTAEISAGDTTPNAPMPATTTATATVTSNAETPLTGFGSITYTAPGTYEYYITETEGSAQGVTYDSTVYNMKVEVADNFTTNVTYSGNDTSSRKAQIKNVYTPTPEPFSATATPAATKTLTGTLPAGFSETFTAEISAKTADAPLPATTTATATVTGNDEVAFVGFGDITFDAPGTYEYEITETKGSAQGVTYDSNVYTMTVEVKEDATTAVTYAGGTTAADKAQIKNVYTPTPTPVPTVEISGTKTWNDNSNAAGIRPDHITLTLTDETGAVVSATPTWTNTSTDQWEYLYAGLPQTDTAGNTKTYSVTEVVVPGYYAAQVTKVDKGNGNYAYNLTNTIIPPDEKTISVVATKVWDDDANAAKTRPENIKFTLVNDKGEASGETPTWTKNANNTWTCTWTNLPAGTYRVEEATVAGYKAPVYSEAKTDANGNVTCSVTNTSEQVAKRTVTPKTADPTTALPLVGIALGAALVLLAAARKVRSH